MICAIHKCLTTAFLFGIFVAGSCCYSDSFTVPRTEVEVVDREYQSLRSKYIGCDQRIKSLSETKEIILKHFTTTDAEETLKEIDSLIAQSQKQLKELENAIIKHRIEYHDAQVAPERVSVRNLGNRVFVTGIADKPLGKVMTIQGRFRGPGVLVEVESVDGIKLSKSETLPVEGQLQGVVYGDQCTLIGYETLILLKKFPNSPIGFPPPEGYQPFGTHFVITEIYSPKTVHLKLVEP